MGHLLAIDGGRTGCRVALMGPGGREAVGTGRGLPALSGPDGLAGAVQAIGEAVAGCALGPGTIESVAAGLAGLLGAFEQAPTVARHLSLLLGAERVLLTGDVVTAYAGALGLRPGVVVAAGTGAVALGATPGSWARSDGWGHLLGDAGSGFWIGRRGLEAALRASDGRGGSGLLAALAQRHLGPLDGLPARIAASENPTATVAAFAWQVAEAAGQGDDVARAIWSEAASELAASAAACARRLFEPGVSVPVSWSGGLFAAGTPAGNLLLHPFLDELSGRLSGCVPTPPAGDALAGAALLAGPDGPGLLARLVYDSGAADAPRPVTAAVRS